MLIREYTPADLDALRRIHAAQGFAYPFPNLDDPIFVSKLILEDDSGRIAMAALARLTCEMYLLVNREERADNDANHDGVIPSEERAFCATTRDLSSISASGDVDAKRDASGQKALGMTTGKRDVAPRNDMKAPNWQRRDAAPARFAQFFALHAAGEKDLLARGLEDAHAWLPPQVARRFGRRLEALGWTRDNSWTPYSIKFSG